MENSLRIFSKILVKLLEKRAVSEVEAGIFSRKSKEIMEFLVDNPGGIIFLKSKDHINAYRLIFEKIFFNFHEPSSTYLDLYEEFGHIIDDILYSYAERILKLKPLIILESSVDNNLRKVIQRYYNESMRCWAFGLFNSSIIMMFSLIEIIMKNFIYNLVDEDNDRYIEFVRVGEKLTGLHFNLGRLIAFAHANNIISEKSRKALFKLKNIRNKVIHESFSISMEESYRILSNTRKAIEEIFDYYANIF